MLNINRILFPTDFSSVAEDAFSHAAHLALQYDAVVHVFNVVTPQEAGTSSPLDYLPLEPVEDGDDDLYAAPLATVDVETPAQEQASVQVVYRQIESTSPAEAIVDHATAKEVDLIVMGTHGRRGVDRLLRGSVSEEVVREAPCPVFTVLADGEPSPGPYVERVVAPVDLSSQSEMVIAHARELARSYDAALHVLHVIENVAYPNAYGVDPLTPILPDVQKRATEAVQALVDAVRDGEVAIEAITRTGYAAQDILEYVEEIDAGLVVMATHGRTGLERFLIGSVAEKVVRSAPCPVFTLKSFGHSLLPDAAAPPSETSSEETEAEDASTADASPTP